MTKFPYPVPQFVLDVPHRRQLASWDCGLACVSMILSALHKPASTPWDLRLVCPLTSIWTIDLAYILKHYGVEDFTYYTSYIGVNHHHSGKQFYRDTISTDRQRVHELFARARDHGIRVVPIILHLDDMRRFLVSGQYAVLLLVDLGRLRCLVCGRRGFRLFSGRLGLGWWRRWKAEQKDGETCKGKDGATEGGKGHDADPAVGDMKNGREGGKRRRRLSIKFTSSVTRLFCGCIPSHPNASSQNGYNELPPRRGSVASSSSSTLTNPSRLSTATSPSRTHTPTQPPEAENFVGHYILLVGYDPDKDLFLYRDPGTAEEICAVKGEEIDRARNCIGTDHDCIVARVR